MAESRKERPAEVLYVYDRICPKASKQREILKEYGTDLKMKRSAPQSNAGRGGGAGQARGSGQGRTNPPGNAGRQRNSSAPRGGGQAMGYGGSRARAYAADATRERTRDSGYRQSGHGQAGYRPSGGYYGAAVKERPFKLLLDSIINFIDTVEERGRNDERIAKRRAIAARKWSEYKNIVRTMVILLLVAALFITAVYNLFFKIKNISVEGSAAYSTENIILAAGISEGELLYSFDPSAVAQAITFRCPYIKSVDISRSVPNKVSLTLTEDTAVYYACIWGDWLKLSSGLRVLEVTDEESAKAAGLTKLTLPKIVYSVAGGVIEFEDTRHERFIRDTLTAVEESQLSASGRIDSIDLSNEYDITMEYDGKYLMEYGGEADLELKLLMGYKTITNDKFEAGVPAKIDLGTVGEASVKYDHSLSTNSSK